MSGGTDSSVAALLLQDAGYEVTGITFRFYEKENDTEYLEDARALCERLNIPHLTYDVRDTFRKTIIDYFINEYMAGHTPVPCTLCNNYLKWPLLKKISDEMGIYHFATGHYVRRRFINGCYHITTGADSDKDQSFFLWGLPQEILQRMLLPMGNLTKARVREIAAERGFLKAAHKRDSLGVCFCPMDYRTFLHKELPEGSILPGKFFDEMGNFIARHKGYPFYTIGQRRGLGIDLNRAVFVKEIIPAENKEQYLISSLMEEAISSSQMEGAATTRKVAKEMLRKSLSPQDKSQQMIFNNYQTIRFITQNIHTPLSSELLQQIHVLMTEKTLENPADAGAYRTNDEVVVEDAITHEVVHTPPSYKDIPSFIEDLCIFFNESDSKVFIHPIIRGIIIHFMIAYMHPFVDGNGRTARALFYWYMLKSGYWLTEYLSISRVIAKSKKSYENAYLYTEADEKDMGYFIAYNLRVLELAFKELQTYIKRKLDQKHQASVFYKLDNINERQADILRLINDNPKILFTVKELQNRFSITHTTAKNDIDGLVERKLVDEISLNKVKKGYVKGEMFDEIVKSIT